MKITRIFYSQPVDFLEKEAIKNSIKKIENLLSDMSVKIIAPYLHETIDIAALSKNDAKKIIEKDIVNVKSCDILLADLSNDKRQAIGIPFEMAAAYFNNIKIIVYTGSSLKMPKRVWVLATSFQICDNWFDVKKAISNLIRTTNRVVNGVVA